MGRPKKVTSTNKAAQMVEKFLADHGMTNTLSVFQVEAAHLIPKIPKTGRQKDEKVPNLVEVWETFEYVTRHGASLSYVPIAPRPAAPVQAPTTYTYGPAQAPPVQASWTPSPLQPQPQPQPQHGEPPKRQRTDPSATVPPVHTVTSVQTMSTLTPRAIVKAETDHEELLKTETGDGAVFVGLHDQQSRNNTNRDFQVKEESLD